MAFSGDYVRAFWCWRAVSELSQGPSYKDARTKTALKNWPLQRKDFLKNSMWLPGERLSPAGGEETTVKT